MRDGVLVAEVIDQKLAGKMLIEVQLEFEEQEAEPAAPEAAPEPPKSAIVANSAVAPAPAVAPKSVMMPAIAAKSAAEAAGGATVQSAAVKPIAAQAECALVSILPSGVEANEYPLKADGPTSVGRNADVSFPQDPALSDIHAVIVATGGKYVLQEQGTEAGVLFQSDIERSTELERGAVIRAGRQWVVVGDRKRANSVVHYNEGGQRIAQFELKEGVTVVGRQSPDITIAPDDGSLSRRHFSLTYKGGTVAVKDRAPPNGAQVRVAAPMRLRDGDRIMMGQQVLEFRDDRKIVQPATNVSLDTSFGVLQQAAQQSAAWPRPNPRHGPRTRDAHEPEKSAVAARPQRVLRSL